MCLTCTFKIYSRYRACKRRDGATFIIHGQTLLNECGSPSGDGVVDVSPHTRSQQKAHSIVRVTYVTHIFVLQALYVNTSFYAGVDDKKRIKDLFVCCACVLAFEIFDVSLKQRQPTISTIGLLP